MKRFFALVLALALFAGCVERQPSFSALETGVVERVIDGDTFLLENGERVRLIGIDAPEKGQKCFEESKNRLQELVFGRVVFLVRDVSERDGYGRLVRFVYVDGRLVNLVLVEEGLAFAFEFFPDNSLAAVFGSAEASASGGKGCVWS